MPPADTAAPDSAEIARYKELLRLALSLVQEQRVEIVRLHGEITLRELHPLTRLPSRRKFDSELVKEVLALFGRDVAEQLMANVHPSHIGRQRLEEIDLSLVMIDIAYLTAWNASGHDVGDKALCAFADSVRQITENRPLGLAVPYHCSGDEFTLIVRGGELLAGAIMRKAIVAYRACIITPNQKLIPNADFGVCTLAEALWAYGYYVRTYPVFAPTTSRDKLTRVLEFIRQVADLRAGWAKTLDRMILLAELWNTNRELFNTSFPYLTRGSEVLDLANIKAAARLSEGEERQRFIRRLVDESYRQNVQEDSTVDMTDDLAKRNVIIRLALRKWPFLPI